MIKSTNLCFNIASVWKLVIKNEISYPWQKLTQPHEIEDKGSYRHRFPSQNNKILCSSGKESCQLMCENPFNVISLFDFNTDSNCVDGRFNEDLLILIPGNVHWIQNDFRWRPFNQPGQKLWRGISYFASTSGMLCRSTTWLEKFSRHNAAVRLARTQFRYGRSVFDCIQC